jgi:hypothetical protein
MDTSSVANRETRQKVSQVLGAIQMFEFFRAEGDARRWEDLTKRQRTHLECAFSIGTKTVNVANLAPKEGR